MKSPINSIRFDIMHLEKYAIIEKPCTIFVRNNSRLNFKNMYLDDGHPRWIMNLKAVWSKSLEDIIKYTETYPDVSYGDIGHKLMTGAIWEEQVKSNLDLPVKGEQVIATFDYVDQIMRCTNITIIQREPPRIFMPSMDVREEIKSMERMLKMNK